MSAAAGRARRRGPRGVATASDGDRVTRAHGRRRTVTEIPEHLLKRSERRRSATAVAGAAVAAPSLRRPHRPPRRPPPRHRLQSRPPGLRHRRRSRIRPTSPQPSRKIRLGDARRGPPALGALARGPKPTEGRPPLGGRRAATAPAATGDRRRRCRPASTAGPRRPSQVRGPRRCLTGSAPCPQDLRRPNRPGRAACRPSAPTGGRGGPSRAGERRRLPRGPIGRQPRSTRSTRVRHGLPAAQFEAVRRCQDAREEGSHDPVLSSRCQHPPYEVLVVGAGPPGRRRLLAGHGHDVAVVERKTFPREKTCGDGLHRAVRSCRHGPGDGCRRHRFGGLRIAQGAPWARGRSTRVPQLRLRRRRPTSTGWWPNAEAAGATLLQRAGRRADHQGSCVAQWSDRRRAVAASSGPLRRGGRQRQQRFSRARRSARASGRTAQPFVPIGRRHDTPSRGSSQPSM